MPLLKPIIHILSLLKAFAFILIASTCLYLPYLLHRRSELRIFESSQSTSAPEGNF
jgi:hypothetical protein